MVKTKKTILIVIDEADSTLKMAQKIVFALSDCNVLMRNASQFNPTELLGADVCFFGCEKPKPVSFAALEQVLLHINLAGRPCGLFSQGQENAISYLKTIIKDSEISLVTEPCRSDKANDIKTWTNTVIEASKKKK